MKVRAAVSALLAAVLAVGITGCSFGAPQMPHDYDPSDGVGASVGDLDVRNAILFSQEGDRGSLVVSVVNRSDQEQTLDMQYGGAGARETMSVDIPGGTIMTFGYDGTRQLVMDSLDTRPGALYPIYFSSGDAEGVELKVPVLDTTLAEYDGLLPSPKPTPSATPTPIPIPVPSAGTAPQGDNTGTTQPGDSVDSGEKSQ